MFIIYLSHIWSTKKTMKNNSNIRTLFKQTILHMENTYKDIAGFDMSFDDFEHLCRQAWKDDFK